jgi:hypothetical protein
MFSGITKDKDANFLNRITDKTISIAQYEIQKDIRGTIDDFKPMKNYSRPILACKTENVSILERHGVLSYVETFFGF